MVAILPAMPENEENRISLKKACGMTPELKAFVLPAKWILKLAKGYANLAKKRQDAIEAITNLFGDPEALARYYVEPDCQNFNPANYPESGPDMVLKKPVFQKLAEFFSGDVFEADGSSQLFVLSDAGMGKSSLLVMLKLADLNAFWPKGYRCQLKKLGAETLADIAKMKERQRTILLLDALDEDPLAWGRIEDRIAELLQATKHFRRVIFTCRTQFFPIQQERSKFRDDRIKIAGFWCPTLYLSYFNEPKVRAYLKKRFRSSLWDMVLARDNARVGKAQDVLANMKTLSMRPMLLAHIEDLMDKEPLSSNEYLIYHAMVEAWLEREVRKDVYDGQPPSTEPLWSVCGELATRLQSERRREISEEELDRFMLESPALRRIKGVSLSGRSLLNKNSEGAYRFAHLSVQEFLAVHHVVHASDLDLGNPLEATDQMRRFLIAFLSWKKIPINPNWFKDLVQPSFTINLENAALKMAWVSLGVFSMGSPPTEQGRSDDEVQHKVAITEGFWLGETPVTQSQWQAVMGDNPSRFKGANRPVEYISWEDAQRFIAALNEREGREVYRLPTEAEWEYACRAGTTGPYAGDLNDMGWYDENSGGETRDVAQKQPNAWGLYDMHGNVWEWCSDWYGAYSGQDETDPRGPSSGSFRVVRGGSWSHWAGYCRSAFRDGSGPGYRGDGLGFRLLRMAR